MWRGYFANNWQPTKTSLPSILVTDKAISYILEYNIPYSNSKCAYLYFRLDRASVLQFCFCNYQFNGVHKKAKPSLEFWKILDVLLLCICTVMDFSLKDSCQEITSSVFLIFYSLSPEVQFRVTGQSGWCSSTLQHNCHLSELTSVPPQRGARCSQTAVSNSCHSLHCREPVAKRAQMLVTLLVVHPECKKKSMPPGWCCGGLALQNPISYLWQPAPIRNLLTEAFHGKIPGTLLDEGRDCSKFHFVHTCYKPSGNTVAQFSKRRQILCPWSWK